MNRPFLLIVAIVLPLCTLFSCAQEESEIPVERVSINQPTAEMEIGETIQLHATVSPSNATHKEVIWSSSKKSVASVSDTGLVTALAEGSTAIYATADGKTAECAITVSKGIVEVTSISLNKDALSLIEGDSETLTATVKPDDATDKTVTWTTSDTSVATVDNGVVTAVKVGTATITAEAGDKSATCTISVVPTPVTSVTLNQTSASLKARETLTLTATVKPDDATDKTVSWTTSDASVATVDNGVVTAVKVGTATITAEAGDKSATCTISVVPTPVTSVTLNQTSASLKARETLTLTATVKPDDATDKTVSWTTSDASVATVDNGVVTAVKVGTATITAKAGDKSATCAISVIPTPVTSITLDQTSASLMVGETVSLTATVKPDDATDKTVTWTTSDASVATVDNGVVTAIKLGSASITAKAGDKSATCAISVIPTPVTSITLDQTSVSLVVGETITLTATVKPDDATDKTVSWSSSDESVVTVDASGNLTAFSKGKATITVTVNGNSSITAICQVVISNPCPEGAVDLGIKTFDGYNLYWATSNLSVNGLCENPEDYGDYYAWGELEPHYDSLNPIIWKEGKSDYGWASYKWCTGDYNGLTKYCSSSNADFWEGEGAPDGKTDYRDYDNADDAAYVTLGDNWHTPTYEEWNALINNCKDKWVEDYNGTGIQGRIFISKISGYTDKSIFFPCAGCFTGKNYWPGGAGLYWCSRIYYSFGRSYEAWRMGVTSSRYGLAYSARCEGYSIRPVTF